jgi:hypothetical protein
MFRRKNSASPSAATVRSSTAFCPFSIYLRA